MHVIQASEFKAKCLALMDQVARTGETIVVTKNGRPFAELRPHRPPRAKSLIGIHKGQIEIRGGVADRLPPLGSHEAIVLDTHVLVWADAEDRKLGRKHER